MEKLCSCGCGQATKAITQTDKKHGRIKGEYNKFVSGHNSKGKNNPMWKGSEIKYTCKFCGKEFYDFKSRHRIHCSKKCCYLSIKELIPWNRNKDGRIKSFGGYMLILMPNHPFCYKCGHIFEHRLVIEKQIGRYLTQKETVHHLNEIKDDNRPENLMAFTSKSAHMRFHRNPNNVNPSEIIFDGRLL